jgi:hypothetical protein
MSSITSSVKSPVLPELQKHLAQQLWPSPKPHFIKPYFSYYTEQCRTAWLICSGHIATKKHQDVLDIADDIKKGQPRPEVKRRLLQRLGATGEDDSLDVSIDLVVRLILMLDVGEFRNAYSGRKRLVWEDGPISGFVQDLFNPQPSLAHDGVKLNPTFNARNLDRIAGFKVELTPNLADHLRFRDENKTVTVFHHASFLRLQDT